MFTQLVSEIADLLLASGETVSTAESCTGGLIGGAFTALPGSSSWYSGGIISYANEAKMNLLAVPEELLETVGAVSPEVAEAMGVACNAVLRTDWAISVTGIAGPGGGTEGKPVGLVYIGVASINNVTVTKNIFAGDRDEVRRATIEKALSMLKEQLEK